MGQSKIEKELRPFFTVLGWSERRNCEGCLATTPYNIVVEFRYATVLFCIHVVFSRRYILFCSKCGVHWEISELPESIQSPVSSLSWAAWALSRGQCWRGHVASQMYYRVVSSPVSKTECIHLLGRGKETECTRGPDSIQRVQIQRRVRGRLRGLGRSSPLILDDFCVFFA